MKEKRMKMLKRHAGKIVLAIVCAVLLVLGFMKPSQPEEQYPFAGITGESISYAGVYYWVDEYEFNPEEKGAIAPLLDKFVVYGEGEEEYEVPAGMNSGLYFCFRGDKYHISVSPPLAYINGVEYEADMADALELSDMITELVKKYHTE